MRGERQAASFLRAKGLRLVECNYHCRFGEVDLIMRDDEQWVFVEVRSRTSSRFMHPLQSIGPAKQRRLWLTAQFYLQRLPQGQFSEARMDVVTVLGGRCEWIPNAFTC